MRVCRPKIYRQAVELKVLMEIEYGLGRDFMTPELFRRTKILSKSKEARNVAVDMKLGNPIGILGS